MYLLLVQATVPDVSLKPYSGFDESVDYKDSI